MILIMRKFHTDDFIILKTKSTHFLLGNRKNMKPVKFAKTKSVNI